MYKIIVLPEFKKKIKKIFDKQQQKAIEDFILKDLKFKGNKIGKPLSYPYLREKKIIGKRIYYLIYNDLLLILLVDASNKKAQKETINKIKEFLPKYEKLAYKYYFNG